jgi:protein-S-isoprenylcysteine O-methyltransferase Ste14
MIYASLILSWIAFGYLHSLLASTRIKQQMTQWLGRRGAYYRLIFNGVALLTLMGVLFLHRQAPIDYVWPPHWVGRFLGSLYALVGIVICGLALSSYDLAEFIGWPVRHSLTATPVLKQSGLLSYVRHPLYLGTILILAGLYMRQPIWSNCLCLLMGALYIRVGIYFEEAKLIGVFGDTYRNYRRQVPMLMPSRRFKRRR